MVAAAPDGGSTTSSAGPLAVAMAVNPFLAPLGGLIAGAIQIVMTQEAVDEVNGHLEAAEEALHAARTEMATIAASGAGSFWWASQLTHHAGLANDRLTDSLVEMNGGLELFKEGIELAMKGVTTADEQAAADNRKGLSCITPGTSPAAPGCGVTP